MKVFIKKHKKEINKGFYYTVVVKEFVKGRVYSSIHGRFKTMSKANMRKKELEAEHNA